MSPAGHLETVKALLGDDIYHGMLTEKCNLGQTPLIKAVRNGHLKIVEAITRLPADKIQLNEPVYRGRTVFTYACIDGRLDVVAILAKLDGLNINATDEGGSTGFILAWILSPIYSACRASPHWKYT